MKIFHAINDYLLKSKIDDLIDELILNNFTNETILKYIKKIPREFFVKKKFINFSYHNRPLPIDCNQTISQPLVVANKINHAKLNLKNISYLLGDGSNGWNKAILFDSIIISAASKEVPPKLFKTLKTNGKIIFPKKYTSGQQKLLLLKKINEFNYSTKELFDVSFVPLL